MWSAKGVAIWQILFFTDYKKGTISRGLRNWPAISNIQVLKKGCHFGKRCEGLLWNEELRIKWNEASSKETKKSVKNEKGDKNHSPLFPITGNQPVKEHKMWKNEVSVPLPCIFLLSHKEIWVNLLGLS